jgi:acetoin utilization deacetylase AcuC-like enzyme
MIAGQNLPTLFVLEGGYDITEMGENVVSVLRGYEKNV